MYDFFLDGRLLPITPDKLQLKINNQNRTCTLIDQGEVNMLKSPGLTDVSFSMLLTDGKFPYSATSGSIPDWLDNLERLKTGMSPFRFIVARYDGSFDTNLRVTMEDYTIREDAAALGRDVLVSVNLKQYRTYGTKTVTVVEETASTTEPREGDSQPAPTTYVVQPNDGFWLIAKKTLGDGGRMYDVASYNGMTIHSTIHPGDVLRIPPK